MPRKPRTLPDITLSDGRVLTPRHRKAESNGVHEKTVTRKNVATTCHPKRRLGLLPVIEISNGTYYSKKFKSDRPKPIFTIDGWVTADGEAPAAKAVAAAQHAEFNDTLPF